MEGFEIQAKKFGFDMLRNRESLKFFGQASYMVKLIEEHYFSDCV